MVKSLLLGPYVEHGPKAFSITEVKWYMFDLLAIFRKNKTVCMI